MVSAKAVVSAAVPVGRSSVRNSTFGQRMYAVDRTPDIRLTSRCTPAAMPKVSVESSTRSTPSVPTVRRIRRTMLAFSVLGNTDACEMIRRISLPDMGFGMMPIALPSTTVTGSGRCELISLITHRYPGLEAPPFRAGRNARSAGLSDPAERLGGCPGSACTRRRRRRRRCSGTARRPGSAGTWRWSRPTPTAPPAARPPRTSPRSVGNWPRPGRSTPGWPPAARPSSSRPCAISTRPGATSTAAPTGGRPGARPAGTRASGSSADRPAGSAGSTVAGPRSECRSSAGSGSGSAGPSPYAKSYRVTRDSAGRWHIAFAAIPAAIPAPGTGEVVGADRGVAVAAALATGELRRFDPDSLDAQVRRTQRRLCRAQRGSHRRRRVKARLARLHARRADARKDWVGKLSTDLARRFDLIRVEDLRVRNMTRSAKGTVDAPGTNVRQKAGHHPVVLPADAGDLVTAERRTRGVLVVAVGPDPAGLDAAAHPVGPGAIARPDAGTEAVKRVVGDLQRVRVVGEGGDGKDQASVGDAGLSTGKLPTTGRRASG